MTDNGPGSAEALEIRRLIEEWAGAVRRRDLVGILRHHSSDLVMFDVPPPFESTGLDAYEASWSLFFAASPEPAVFDIRKLDVIAGFTIGFRKIEGQWMFVHEHHSVPADD